MSVQSTALSEALREAIVISDTLTSVIDKIDTLIREKQDEEVDGKDE